MAAELVLAAPEQMQLASIGDQMASVEVWAGECTSVPELQDAANQLAAIELYLERTSKDGMARVAATERRLEVRIGELLGPATVGAHSSATEGGGLSRHERSDFRDMAKHPEVVEDEIARSSDEAPASRRKVTESIREHRAPKPAFSADPEVALIERRHEISLHIERLQKAWARVAAADPFDLDKQHATTLRVLGREVIRYVERQIRPPAGTVDAAAQLTDRQEQVLDTAAKDRARPPVRCEACDEPLTKANTTLDPDCVGDVCDGCQEATGGPDPIGTIEEFASALESALEAPEDVEVAGEDGDARQADASSPVEGVGEVETSPVAPSPTSSECWPCDGMGRLPGGEVCEDCAGTGQVHPVTALEQVHPFTGYERNLSALEAARGHVRGPELVEIINRFEAAKTGFLGWLAEASIAASKTGPDTPANLLQELTSDFFDAKGDEQTESELTARARGALRAWVDMAKEAYPPQFIDAVVLRRRPATSMRGNVTAVHTSEIVAAIRARAKAAA